MTPDCKITFLNSYTQTNISYSYHRTVNYVFSSAANEFVFILSH